MKLCICIARTLRSVTIKKGSPAFRCTFPHSRMCIVIRAVRGLPVFTVNGVWGAAVTESAVVGWAIRLTDTGGPESWLTLTVKLNVRSPAFGWVISPRYDTETVCDG